MKLKIKLKYDQLSALLTMVAATYNRLHPEDADDILDKINLRDLRMALLKKRESKLGENQKKEFTVSIEVNQFASFRRRVPELIGIDQYYESLLCTVINEGIRQLQSKKHQLIT